MGTIGCIYECGEDTAVYFDPASGNTHLISDFAAYLARHLASAAQPLDIAEIIELVRIDVEAEDLPELSLAVPEILNALADLGIVDPV
jgi:hypothetical protein